MGLFRLTPKPLPVEATTRKGGPAAPVVEEVQITVRPRTDVANGVFEVTVTVDDQKPSNSTFVLTSPRDLAFRKAG